MDNSNNNNNKTTRQPIMGHGPVIIWTTSLSRLSPLSLSLSSLLRKISRINSLKHLSLLSH